MRSILTKAVFIWLAVAYIVTIDCNTAFSAPLMQLIHGTSPAGPGGMSSATGVVLAIFAMTGALLAVGLGAIRIFIWLILAKTGWMGRAIGMVAILGILDHTGTAGKCWRRDYLVRMIWNHISDKKLKSLHHIYKNAKAAASWASDNVEPMRAAA